MFDIEVSDSHNLPRQYVREEVLPHDLASGDISSPSKFADTDTVNKITAMVMDNGWVITVAIMPNTLSEFQKPIIDDVICYGRGSRDFTSKMLLDRMIYGNDKLEPSW